MIRVIENRIETNYLWLNETNSLVDPKKCWLV